MMIGQFIYPDFAYVWRSASTNRTILVLQRSDEVTVYDKKCSMRYRQ